MLKIINIKLSMVLIVEGKYFLEKTSEAIYSQRSVWLKADYLRQMEIGLLQA